MSICQQCVSSLKIPNPLCIEIPIIFPLFTVFTFIGVIFDVLVWWYGRNIELYEENEGQNEPGSSKKPLKELR